jgi:hypothetical protein
VTPAELIKHWRFRAHRVQLAHYESARKFGHRHLWLGFPAIILSTVVGTSVFATLAKSADQVGRPWLQIIIGLLSVLSAVLASLQTFLRSSELAEKHRLAGARFANLKHDLELLATMPPPNSDQLRDALSVIEQRWAKLREESPNLPEKIWTRIEQTLTYEKHEKRYPTLAEKT